MKKIIAYIILIAFICGMVNGCGGNGSASISSKGTEGDKNAKSEEKELIFATTGIVPSMDPHVDWNGWFTVRYGIGETLFQLDEQMEIQPWLAESYENIDETTWKIVLKDGLTFSNGQAVTAEKVIANMKRFGKSNFRAAVFATAEYEAYDDKTIIIKTRKAYATLINDLCDPFSAILDIDNTKDFENEPVCTGPYSIMEFIPDQAITLKKNRNYWNGDPKLNKAYIKVISDMDTMAMALQSGEIDIAHNITADSVSLFNNTEEYTISTAATSRSYMLYYNMETMPDKAVREAVSKAIDRQGICENLLCGSASVGTGAFSSDFVYGGSAVRENIYNVEEAKEILEKAGYYDSNGDGILDKDGIPLKLNLVLYPRLAQEAIATEIQAELKRIGIDIKIKVYESSDYLSAGNFDIGMLSIVTNSVGDGAAFLDSSFRTGMDSNYNGYSNSEVDHLLDQLKVEFDKDKRAQLVINIQKKVLGDYSCDFIAFNNMTMIMKSNVTGFKSHPTDYYQFNINADVN